MDPLYVIYIVSLEDFLNGCPVFMTCTLVTGYCTIEKYENHEIHIKCVKVKEVTL